MKIAEEKVVFMGDFGVGKSTLVSAMVNSSPGVLAPEMVRLITVPFLGQRLALHIWDPPNTLPNPSQLSPLFYRNAALGVLVFALDAPQSPDTIFGYYDRASEYGIQKFILVGNKSDQKAAEAVDILRTWAIEKGIRYLEVSAKNTIAIHNLLTVITESVGFRRTEHVQAIELEEDNRVKKRTLCS
jgi:GTPase SAR1 family protein